MRRTLAPLAYDIIMKTIFLLFLSTLVSQAKLIEYDLEIANSKFTPGNGLKAVPALTVNGGIPGPTLRLIYMPSGS